LLRAPTGFLFDCGQCLTVVHAALLNMKNVREILAAKYRGREGAKTTICGFVHRNTAATLTKLCPMSCVHWLWVLEEISGMMWSYLKVFFEAAGVSLEITVAAAFIAFLQLHYAKRP
jgi:hypothetical protein